MLGSDTNKKLPIHYSGKFQGSFAYLTIKDRLPVILVKVVDTLCQDKNSIGAEHGEIGKEEIKRVIGRLSALQNEMVTNKPIKPLTSNGSDVPQWNAFLELQNVENEYPASWFVSSWLYVECYLYRRIKEAFELSPILNDYDPFCKQKLESLLNSMDDLEKLGKTLTQTINSLESSLETSDMYSLLKFYLEISLWGNKCDLSLFAGKENVPHTIEIGELKSKILINDTEKVWNLLKHLSGIHLHFVLDNAGFELFCDFCFLHYLLASKLVTKVSIHVKRIPWFVSDTLEKDIQCMLETLLNSNRKVLVGLSTQWLANLASGVWNIENELFWTLPHDYSEMLLVDPQLYHKLSRSDLVIFKGDLNYRKLTGDRQWNEETPFRSALNQFVPTSLLSLRTVKADVVVGLESGTTQKFNNVSENWKFSGQYALIQFVSREM